MAAEAADKNFTWSDEEINLLLNVVIDYRARKAGEGVDWETARSNFYVIPRNKQSKKERQNRLGFSVNGFLRPRSIERKNGILYSKNSLDKQIQDCNDLSSGSRHSKKIATYTMVDSEDNYEESRFRKRTAKGREFHIELMKDQWTAAQRAWRKQLNKIENLLTDSNEITPLISERNLLETKMEISSEAHERLDDALEEDYETKRVVQEKYETWEREHSDALKRVNSRVAELKQERESTKSTATKSSRSSRRSSNDSRASKSSTLERKVDSAAKVAKLKTELLFVDAEVERTAALRWLNWIF
ncbi:hypothetical protein ACROYT_G028800 [Oculina patagonica]